MPGRSSISRCPRASMQATASLTACCLPSSTWLIASVALLSTSFMYTSRWPAGPSYGHSLTVETPRNELSHTRGPLATGSTLLLLHLPQPGDHVAYMQMQAIQFMSIGQGH